MVEIFYYFYMSLTSSHRLVVILYLLIFYHILLFINDKFHLSSFYFLGFALLLFAAKKPKEYTMLDIS